MSQDLLVGNFTHDLKKLRDREKRYLKKYGPFMTLELYNKILAAQDFKCGACGRPASNFNLPLAIDHEHFKVNVERRDISAPFPHLKWYAYTEVQGKHLAIARKTRAAAIAALKEAAMPHSIRGLLCPGRHGPAGTCCNRNMGRIDKPEWLKKVVRYLENPPARKVLDFS